jgi:hypothetical protein
MSYSAATSVRIRRLPSKPPTKRALTLLLCAITTAFGASCAHAVGGRYATLSVVTRGDNQVLPVYAKDGRNWVVGTPNQEYALRVCNSTGGRVLAVMSVDGVNIITGDTASPLQSGYVLSAWECADIGGWRKSLARTAAFYFTELPDAYAARTGRPENVGVIGVAVFPEKARVVRKDAPMPMARQEMRDSGSNAPATANDNTGRAAAESSAQASSDASGGASGKVMRSEATPPAAPMAKLGTGHGRSENSPTQMVAFERASDTPAEMLTINYDRRDNLIAMGILPRPAIASMPNAFPSWTPRFAPDPPR